MELVLLVIVELSDGDLLILMELSLKLSPAVDVYAFISVGLKDLDFSIEVND